MSYFPSKVCVCPCNYPCQTSVHYTVFHNPLTLSLEKKKKKKKKKRFPLSANMEFFFIFFFFFMYSFIIAESLFTNWCNPTVFFTPACVKTAPLLLCVVVLVSAVQPVQQHQGPNTIRGPWCKRKKNKKKQLSIVLLDFCQLCETDEKQYDMGPLMQPNPACES